jgi:membrane protein insertase Oxa1/YidC/SpoIIIJ
MFAILMPAVMGFSLWHYASGLSLYWLTGTMISLLIQFVINTSKLGKERHALTSARAKINPKTNED